MPRPLSRSLLAIASAIVVAGCGEVRPAEPTAFAESFTESFLAAKPSSSGFATVSTLPALDRTHGEAYAVDRAGSIIAGYSWDRAGRMNPVTWTLQSGTWRLTALPYAASATSATARAVNDGRDVAGYDFPASTTHAVLWPASGGFTVLGCGTLGEAQAISAAGRTVAGIGRGGAVPTAAVWEPGGCRVDLPPLVAGGSAAARAVSANGNIVGGSAANDAQVNVPVRWTRAVDGWRIEALDARPGSVHGSNSAGDLVGNVQVACASGSGCSRGIVWYAAGGSRDIGSLGGESTAPRAINDAREVVGGSAPAGTELAPFIWSESLGMRRLPGTDGGWAFAVSGVRADGTRLVVGAGGRPFGALVWVVRNP